MIENLKIAIKRQKRLILIFFLTIFLPSISLSIFGIRAIRSERFRLAEQIKIEFQREADYIKAQVKLQVDNVLRSLQALSQHSAITEKDSLSIKHILNDRFSGDSLIEHLFVAYQNEEPIFPFFFPDFTRRSESPPQLKGLHLEKLKKAEGYEFQQKKYGSAVSHYREIFSLSKDKNIQARMLNYIGRCLMKLERYHQAIENYQKICEEYSGADLFFDLPLDLVARLQIIHCYQRLGDSQKTLESALRLFMNILNTTWPLNRDRFKTYSSLVSEIIKENITQINPESSREAVQKEFQRLNDLYQTKWDKWRTIDFLKDTVIPHLQRQLVSSSGDLSVPYHYSGVLDNRDVLTIAVHISSSNEKNPLGMLGAAVDVDYLKGNVLGGLVEDIQSRRDAEIAVTSLSGSILVGESLPTGEPAVVTEYFDGQFPPWRIELFQDARETSGAVDLKSNFYFWTILTLIIVLTFGTVLVVRTVAHEMEVLKIKSDFVSSVSHEFKTPLTSIKALVERLRGGKVESQDKLKQYYDVIAQGAERLSSLVANILDFSKIEEGKKEYVFTETDLAQLVAGQVESFAKWDAQKGKNISLECEKNLPLIILDKEAVSQAIINLLENAIKFSADKKNVEVEVKRHGENVILTIKDEGIGIPEDEVERIFEKFYQARNAADHSSKGTGLGLTLVKHTMEAHGGRVSVQSNLGEGSAFSLIFPIRKEGK
jgi:signal transduction histidine kinase/tetratricopeptide (TPR) repeat protein